MSVSVVRGASVLEGGGPSCARTSADPRALLRRLPGALGLPVLGGFQFPRARPLSARTKAAHPLRRGACLWHILERRCLRARSLVERLSVSLQTGTVQSATRTRHLNIKQVQLTLML